MVPFAPFSFYIRRKLFMHNMSHALTAYLGALCGYTYIWEAISDSRIKEITSNALLEASKALSLEYGVDINELKDFSDNLIERFHNKLLGDTIERVGKDTKRKLSKNDRFVGTALLCEKLGIEPTNILIGLSAGLFFDFAGDDASIEVANYTRENGVIKALATYSGLEENSKIAKIVEENYNKIKAKI